MIVNNTYTYPTTLYHYHRPQHLHLSDIAYAHGCYSIYHLKLTLLPHSILQSMAHFSLISTNALTSLYTVPASAVYTLCHLPKIP
ncbi:ADQ_G0022880.mRNA.1.CDS.1 [Saccharomyces cerevisiae]|nr:ADQ_G0022880.mRNA.1.CDS.1 [Saccharomyces cerevisiae]CAI6698156.1 ADQ_G0022880.mRNA.1.CDS.1 [Saccharomyces cerevisiae]